MNQGEIYQNALVSACTFLLVAAFVLGLIWDKADFKWRHQPWRVNLWACLCTVVFLGGWLFLDRFRHGVANINFDQIDPSLKWASKYFEIYISIGQKFIEFVGIPVITALFLLALTFKIDKSALAYQEEKAKLALSLSDLDSKIGRSDERSGKSPRYAR